ncbi:RDD family protein [Corynebacterium aquilae]|uniref:Membrane protein n=1 Tax=Corynebacterium aquilae DSM 44791 TaxID=1431546 RepID=A0A1L7CH08_9CORY|nr:RDD family protein [Corynebacterium aquilae]APT85138.1 membrane protein [Corynebacterium aquilae DSM 44791]
MARKDQSWLDTPTIAGEADFREARWPGEFLGLPEKGPGALVSVLRRCGGLWADWIIAMLAATIVESITDFFGGMSTVTLIAFFIISIISVSLFARTPGQAIFRMGVARIDEANARVGVGRAVVRALLTVLILPPILVDSDGRGLHDRVTQTAVIFG